LKSQNTQKGSKPEAKAKVKVKVDGGFRRAYWRWAYFKLDPHMERVYKLLKGIEPQIRKGGTKLSYKAYVCGMMLTTAIVTGIGLVAGVVLASLIPFPLGERIGLPFGLAIAAGFAAFGLQFLSPRLKLGSRKRKIDEELAFVVGRMAVLSASGMTPETVIREVASDDSNELLIQEFRKIVRDMNLLGMDLTQALQEARKRSASDEFAAFLDGMISTSNSGADIQQYLIKQSKTLMNDKRLKTKQFSETLGIIAEMYTTILVVMPLILIILFAVMGVISGSLGGISITLLIELVVYVMVPIGGTVIMVMADGIMPKR
jgi:archaellum biogenesis protein FlaJ (TadC family)